MPQFSDRAVCGGRSCSNWALSLNRSLTSAQQPKAERQPKCAQARDAAAPSASRTAAIAGRGSIIVFDRRRSPRRRAQSRAGQIHGEPAIGVDQCVVDERNLNRFRRFACRERHAAARRTMVDAVARDAVRRCIVDDELGAGRSGEALLSRAS